MVKISLKELLNRLDQHEESIPLEVLGRTLKELQPQQSDFDPFVYFGNNTYKRNLIHEGPAYQALLLCWRSGQRSPIHDHRGSACSVRVLSGIATETVFEHAENGMIYATRSTHQREGAVCATEDADIHQISNLQPAGTDLLTLHIYSPPLLKMGTYSLTDATVREFVDPVHIPLFNEGEGI